MLIERELHFSDFRLDLANEQLWRGDKQLRLRRKTFQVLRYLIAHPRQLVTKEALLDRVWADVAVSDSMPSICVAELRKALGDARETPSLIETVHGRGYRFIGKLDEPALSVSQSEAGEPNPQRKPVRRWFDLTLRDSGSASRGKGRFVGPTIRSASLVDYPDIARSVGLDPYKMLQRVGLPRSCLRNPDLRISADAVAELLQASASAAGLDDLALRLAQRRGLSNVGPLALLVREQPTVRKAVEVLIQYMDLHSNALCPHLEERDRVVTISHMLSGKRLRTRQALELAVAMFYRIIKTFLGDAWRPEQVCFMHSAPKDPEAHNLFFGARVRFSWDYDGIVCRAADLEKSIPTADRAMARYLKAYFDSILPSARLEVSETVRELVWVMLKSGNCSVKRVAKHLGVDRRTINRRLASEGQSYSSILDAVRRDMVTSFVEKGQRPLKEVALLLGFSELSAFSRWFSNRFGRSASEWRAVNLQETHRNSPFRRK